MRRCWRCWISSAKSIRNCSAGANPWVRALDERTGSVSGLRYQSFWLRPRGTLGALPPPLSDDSDALPVSEPVVGSGHPGGQLPGYFQANQAPALATFDPLGSAHQRRRLLLCQRALLFGGPAPEPGAGEQNPQGEQGAGKLQNQWLAFPEFGRQRTLPQPQPLLPVLLPKGAPGDRRSRAKTNGDRILPPLRVCSDQRPQVERALGSVTDSSRGRRSRGGAALIASDSPGLRRALL